VEIKLLEFWIFAVIMEASGQLHSRSEYEWLSAAFCLSCDGRGLAIYWGFI
jgi:hypothetical protein